MGAVVNLMDRLSNLMTGMGTSIDRRTAASYVFNLMTPEQAEAAYRTSWLVRKIVDIPPLDMTREWRDWQAESTDIEKIEAEEKRLGLKAKCKRALILSRLYGGGALILGTKVGDPMQPVNAESVGKDGLAYVHVMSRQQLSIGPEIRDPVNPWFGKPEWFQINTGPRQSVKLHPSRVVEFIGQKAPEGAFYSNGDWFWGDPVMQSIGEAVKHADTAQAGFAALIDEAKLDIIGIPDLMAIVGTDEGTQRLANRFALAATGKSTWRTLMHDKEEEWDQRQVTWAGIPEIMTSFLNIVAGAADIPMTRLLGESPKGLQSTGDGEERDYHAMVKARQDEMLAPALDRIDELLIRSALGSVPSDVYYEFAPLTQTNPKEAADIEKIFADAAKVYSDTAMIPDVALSEMAKNGIIERGQWPGSEAAFEEAALAPDEDEGDEEEIKTAGENVVELKRRGTINQKQADALLTDARPRSLYVSRKLVNAAEVIKWAKGQGFETTLPAAEMHVTVCYSKTPVDWMKVGSPWSDDGKGNITVPPGGARIVEPLGDKGAVVLLFGSSNLSWRHEEIVRAGASHDFDDYQPHVTITYAKPDGLDLAKVEPYRGKLVFGPEIFAEIEEEWAESLTEA